MSDADLRNFTQVRQGECEGICVASLEVLRSTLKVLLATVSIGSEDIDFDITSYESILEEDAGILPKIKNLYGQKNCIQ